MADINITFFINEIHFNLTAVYIGNVGWNDFFINLIPQYVVN
jgi:hypothetical protein